ncbi:extracellular solute-binding protein [Streptomyces spinoverrucosus]|uniref:ABC transporter substrate-binding protein n=1 Tax=Streptomyces spinoverrucosus TaxID=284043 RepID=UPI0018C371B3|nr:extracellular solute-binding protein [Streptomyces spinoverrucosus]MBG0851381.1 extracellular solute-binding protein [Streptomyces spinoverrucosus]
MTTPLPRRRFLQLTGAAALGTTVLSACGTGAGASGNQIELWNAFASKDIENYFQQHFVDGYNKSVSGGNSAKVRMTVKQIDTLDRLTQTAVASGSGPDIITTSGPAQTLSFVDNDNLLPLDSYVDKLGWQDAFLPWALDTGRFGGKLYALPSNLETLSVYYNPATLKQHGWQPPKSRAEFEDLCKDAKAKGITPVAAGNAEWKRATEWHVSWVLNTFAGPEILHEALTGQRRWTDPVFVDAIALLKGWFDKGWFGGGTDRYFTNKFTAMYEQLASGKAALLFNGSWTFSEITPYFGKEAGNDATWDWAPLPSMNSGVPAGVQPLSIGVAFSLNSDCEHPAQAAAALDYFLADATRQLGYLSATGVAPSPVKMPEQDFPADIDPRIKRQYLQLNSAKNIGYTTWTFWPPKSDTYLAEQMEKVLTGDLSPKDYCAGLDKVFQEELKAGKRPPLPDPNGA